MDHRVELLAPAGNYEAFLGAVNAGADAVYLGGEKFGARAYADNFTTEEICKAIHTAHFMGRKIYLTVNTLLKEEEMEELVPYLRPFHEAGLDGVIVQDIGALSRIRESFPGLSLHASTQMSLTGPEGCAFLKKQGIERIVPARELSLAEVRRMKERTGLEIECFIHGAMCYCYSGQCLFSSVLGGRSGNRGRCAQPCRLPYQILDGGSVLPGVEYPLSLKDMCTVSYLPQLIEAGIDSFKIEGRMKKAEYAAGVTAVYRKYIDQYYEKGKAEYQVSRKDLDKLQSLYIRSELQTGYYERHNGPEMITLHKPSYSGSDEQLLAGIRAAYLREPDKLPVHMKIVLRAGEPSVLQITENGSQTTVSVSGGVVEQAQRAPLRQDVILKQLKKTGNSCVTVSSCELDLEEGIFLSVKELNELRRKGVEAFEQAYALYQKKRTVKNLDNKPTRLVNNTDSVDGKKVSTPEPTAPMPALTANRLHVCEPLGRKENLRTVDGLVKTDILVSGLEQLQAAGEYADRKKTCRRIYLDSDFYLDHLKQAVAFMEKHCALEYYLALPYIFRAGDVSYLEMLTEHLQGISGFLIRNYEEAAYVQRLKECGIVCSLIPDSGLYCFNAESVRFWAHYSREYTLPCELNGKEAGRLVKSAETLGMLSTMIVYGRIPMMVTANCIRKTAHKCTNHTTKSRQIYLKDRYDVSFPVEINCRHCYNIIYNSVPFSLHTQENVVQRIRAGIVRYDFTTETFEECRQILSGGEFPFASYTTGHLKRGVE